MEVAGKQQSWKCLLPEHLELAGCAIFGSGSRFQTQTQPQPVYHLPFFRLLMNTGFSNFMISSFCKTELIFTVMQHSLNRQLLFSPGWRLFMNAVRKRGHSAPFWIVSGLGTTKHRNNRVTGIRVKHKTHHKLLTGTSWLIFSLVRLLNVCLASVSSWITVRWCNYWHSIWLKLPRV